MLASKVAFVYGGTIARCLRTFRVTSQAPSRRLASCHRRAPPVCSRNIAREAPLFLSRLKTYAGTAATFAVVCALTSLPLCAEDASVAGSRLRVSGGSASTGGSSVRSVIKTVTRGVNLEGADFSSATFEGVSFQQSILRQANFANSSLRFASFFDADLSGANLSGSDLTGANFELANLRSVDATNAVLTNAYISSTTKFDGIQITGSDWSETLLRKDQQKYLCDRASGTNPITGIDTRESLMCPPQ